MIDENSYVYCTNCIHFKELINSIASPIYEVYPGECKGCYPFDFEDSKPYWMRPMYQRKPIILEENSDGVEI